MSFDVRNTGDVYKFAMILYDYLAVHGKFEAAKTLGDLADICFANTEEALEAHRKAFREIKTAVPDLPEKYGKALNDALRLLH